MSGEKSWNLSICYSAKVGNENDKERKKKISQLLPCATFGGIAIRLADEGARSKLAANTRAKKGKRAGGLTKQTPTLWNLKYGIWNLNLILYPSSLCSDQEFADVDMVVEGSLPNYLVGSCIHNGCGKFGMGKHSFSHIFDCFSKLHSWHFRSDGSVKFTGRFLHSNMYSKMSF